MPTVPYRGLAQLGILRDPSPYDMPPNAWSGGNNVRFANTKAERAPIWRNVEDALPSAPAFCTLRSPASGYDQVMVADVNGDLWQYQSKTYTKVTPASGYTPAATTQSYSSTTLGEVVYVNNPQNLPVYMAPGDSAFSVLPNWDTTWRCRTLRAYRDYLIALNVEKNGVANTVLVKWSDLTLAGAPPGSWDSTDPTTNAGENPLSDLRTPIVDGFPMRDLFVIYADREIWAMQAVSTAEVFAFTRLFSEGGMIAPNCAVEVDGRHFVFGPTDIYTHDGSQKESLLNDKNHEFIFRNLNVKLAERCFVVHLPQYKEILFAYVSGDADAVFKNPTGCNRAFLYNYVDNTHSFLDLPNVSAITLANVDSLYTWSQLAATATWANTGGSWYDQQDGYVKHIVGVSQALPGQITASRVVAYDAMDHGQLAFPYLSEINSPAYLERVGLDLEEDGATSSVYKLVSRVFPRVTTYRNVPVTVQVGGSLTPRGPVKYLPAVSYDPSVDYKIDVVAGGRYLAIRFSVDTPADFEVTGFDLDVSNNGAR